MAGEHIVVIDDDPDVRDALTLILEPAGYRVTCCSTGPEGKDAVRTHLPDLILLDVMLASPSEGFHLAYELRQDEALAHIPIIMISSIGETMGMDYARELNSDYIAADKFLDKPLEAAVVLAAIRDTLEKCAGDAGR
jgi:DNA-binding response OmpR family regulator